MARTPSQDMFEEAFGSPDGQAEHDGPEQGDPSLQPIDSRDVELDYWRLGGLFFPATLIRLGKRWVVALDVLILAALIGFAAFGSPLLAAAMLLVAVVVSVYELTSIDRWTAEHNARAAARRAEALRRREG